MQPAEQNAEHERACARLGTVLKEKWRIDELLGVGGMAAVYAATHRNGKRVAVKIMHPEMSANRDLTERFLREGYVANKIAHPGAVVILDDDVAEDGAAFIVMELLEGETLDQLWRRENKKLHTDRVISIATMLLDVLAQAHERGIVHRDIKPENVFLTNDGQVKVLDFGIAHLRELSMRPGATMAGLTMGTPGFMSPEQARGEAVDGRSDVWSVGATMFTLLSGRGVHEAATVNLQLAAAMMEDAPPLVSVAPYVSAGVCGIVDRALSFDVGRRWTDARAMQRAAMAIAPESLGGIRVPASVSPIDKGTSGTSLPASLPSDPDPHTWREHVAANWRVTVVALAITAALSGGFLFVRGQSDAGRAATVIAPAAATIPPERAESDPIPAPPPVAEPTPPPPTVASTTAPAPAPDTPPPATVRAGGDSTPAPRSTSRPGHRTSSPPPVAAPSNPNAPTTSWPSPSSNVDPLRRRK